jgi:hypothetical protein
MGNEHRGTAWVYQADKAFAETGGPMLARPVVYSWTELLAGGSLRE